MKLAQLSGVGPKLIEKLAALRITRFEHLLFHLPSRFEDRTQLSPIRALRAGIRAQMVGEVTHVERVLRGRAQLLVVLADESGQVTLRFFHFHAGQIAALKVGTRLVCYGEPRFGPSGLEIVHPEYRAVAGDIALQERLTPIYPATEGLQQRTLRKLIGQALAAVDNDPSLLPALLPPTGFSKPLPELLDALKFLHAPPPGVDLHALEAGNHPMQTRLKLEELVAHRLSLLKFRASVRADRALALGGPQPLARELLGRLGFALTGAQQRVGREIQSDLALNTPMLRLVQGDVGSGKTIIACLAALAAIQAGAQAALAAPTELLAEQHHQSFKAWLEPLGVDVVWLAGKVTGRARETALARIAGGAGMVIGTHALMEESVKFSNLALAIIDEQHRFGVHQRLMLREKGNGRVPHQLIMTATPIPRTLAMTAYADLDLSIIDELPPGRSPVKTVALPSSRRDEVIERIDAACAAGRQAYWVCTLIDESELLEAQAANASFEALKVALPKLRVGLVHGRLKAREKAEVMAQFKAGAIDLLVATTVIEVGVDVPRASLMVIENPERLGLAQLHQLRGRVGRGAIQSSCVLLFQPPLGELSRQRLEVLRESNDGFLIAEKDLELRGPGELLGTRQTGLPTLRIADIVRDAAWLPLAERLAASLATQTAAVDGLIERWIGPKESYAQA